MVVRFDIEKSAKKSAKLAKLFNSKNWLSQKKQSKNRKLPKFNITKARSNFLTFNAKTDFNYLWLTFIKALIF